MKLYSLGPRLTRHYILDLFSIAHSKYVFPWYVELDAFLYKKTTIFVPYLRKNYEKEYPYSDFTIFSTRFPDFLYDSQNFLSWKYGL